MIPDKILVRRIRSILSEAEEMGITDQEIMLQIKDIVPKETIEVERIVYKEKEPINSKEQLEYMKKWRSRKKYLDKMDETEAKKEAKIKNAKKRTSFFCYSCNKPIKINNPEDNEFKIIQKRNKNKKQINITNVCSKGHKLNAFGGWVE